MPGSVYAVVLCEGLQDYVFFRRALSTLGIAGHDIRAVMAPGGKGSGEQFVRENYTKEVAAQRLRTARRRAVLLVVTDADVLSVSDRAASLAKTLSDASVPPRAAKEAIALLIPKRNIETWIQFYVSGPPVDETTVYPKLTGRESECWPAADAFAANAKDGKTPTGAPPSLPLALVEAGRIL